MAPIEVDSSALIPPAETPPAVLTAMRQLSEVTKDDVPRMPERMFVEHILPMLSAPAGTAVDLTRWLDVAGTPLRAIEVVDNVTGETLYRVPPLMRTLPTVFQEEINYSRIVGEAQLRENQHPAVAENYLRQELSKARTGATLLDVETAKQWNAIRQRYGLPLLTIVGPDGHDITQSSVTSSTSSTSGSLEVSDEDESFL